MTNLTADQAALLAAAVDAPSEFNFLNNANAARDRRNLVLRDMAEQHYLTQQQATIDEQTSLPPPADVASPSEEATDPSAGYFTSWIANQLVTCEVKINGKICGPQIYSDGLHIHTTLDYRLQRTAQATIDTILPRGIGGPAAALVAIDNDTGKVRAMVGGYDFQTNQFNLATQAERQPGSAFKVFDLATALENGFKYDTPVQSSPFTYTGAPAFGPFSVKNDEGGYAGVPIPLWEALAVSDNSVFARVGLSRNVGPHKIAATAHAFGITTPVSINPSMVIGGLRTGVTPLDMAHAYETIANGGRLTSGTLASSHCAGGEHAAFEIAPPASCPGPVGIDFVTQPDGSSASKPAALLQKDVTTTTPVLPYSVDQTEIRMMRGVITIGTARSAQISGVNSWGKTGTTNNYVDAWFVGSTPKVGAAPSMTVAVWVGFPKSAKPMSRTSAASPSTAAPSPRRSGAPTSPRLWPSTRSAPPRATTPRRPARPARPERAARRRAPAPAGRRVARRIPPAARRPRRPAPRRRPAWAPRLRARTRAPPPPAARRPARPRAHRRARPRRR